MWRNIRQYYSPVLDLLTFIVMFSMITYVSISYSKLPTEIPIHFNMAGEADGWGHKGTLFGLILLNFHTVLLCFVLNYYLIIRSDKADSLQFMNIPFLKKEELTEGEIHTVKRNTARMLAVSNLAISLTFASVYYDIIQNGLGKENGLGFGVEVMIILVFFPFIYYTLKIYRNLKIGPFRNRT
ncbi:MULTISPECIES: DUF1648 domain-containing protein [Oceanobacillus]|uniref:DUF1648 domain-containing protein n=1 Tax=Oceanobacillus indicireducens TaxID=1004261 RepID=A0A917XWX2_9BACI|nr:MULTISPECIES: DUF1648 domain-containing protein [Oceanobacillus]GGN56079.1 hypothetical protein GCM10007971_15500 [Oceanobacillus indicireducens]